MALLAAMLVSPAAASGATVRLVRPSVDEDGYIYVSDAGKHRNDLGVRFSGHAVLMVEHGRRALTARGGCRRRSPRVVVCRAASPDNSVYLDAGGGKDVVRCRNGDISVDGGGGNDRLLAGTCGSSLRGGSGNDVLVGGRFPDEVRGGGGSDRLYGAVETTSSTATASGATAATTSSTAAAGATRRPGTSVATACTPTWSAGSRSAPTTGTA